MSTENRVRLGEQGSYENLEILMAHARQLRSQAVCEMIIRMATRMGGAFGNLVAPLVKTMRPALPTTGNARPEGAAVWESGKSPRRDAGQDVRLMRTNVSAS